MPKIKMMNRNNDGTLSPKNKANEPIELLEMRASFGITFRPFSIIINLRNNFPFYFNAMQ